MNNTHNELKRQLYINKAKLRGVKLSNQNLRRLDWLVEYYSPSNIFSRLVQNTVNLYCKEISEQLYNGCPDSIEFVGLRESLR